MVILQKHQQEIVNFISKKNNKSILLFNSLGSGKTISSLMSAKVIGNKTIVVCPASLVTNFERESKKLGFKIDIFSYQLFLNNLKKGDNSICNGITLILDEVHNLNSSVSKTFRKIFECSKHAKKVILLSATPVKNSPSELANQASLLVGKSVKSNDINSYDHFKILQKLLKCKVSFYKKNLDDINYPKVYEHFVKLPMTEKYYKLYYAVQENLKAGLPKPFNEEKNLSAYLTGIRLASGKLDVVSPKIKWTIQKIKEDVSENKKVLVYSNFLTFGIDIIKELLKILCIPFSEVTGKLTKAQKDSNVKSFNDNKTLVLLITSAGSEGISLKGTRTTIILDPFFHSTRIDQTLGRSIRYRSHSHLPSSQRRVDVFKLELVKPTKRISGDTMDSADTILYRMSNRKEKTINELYDILQKISIENDHSCK